MDNQKRADFSDKDTQQLAKQDQINELIKGYFSKFDERIVFTIRKYAFKDNGMNQLFKKLNISMPNGVIQQFETLAKFISSFGEGEFRKKVLFSSQDYKFKIQPIISAPPQNGSAATDATQKLPLSKDNEQTAQTIASLKFHEPPRPQTQTTTHQPQQPQKTEPKQAHHKIENTQKQAAAAPQSEAQKQSAPPALPAPPTKPQEQPQDQQGLTWPQVDRRSGTDRRLAIDRRKDVEMIFKNKRFGRNRRSGVERRKNWQPAAPQDNNKTKK